MKLVVRSDLFNNKYVAVGIVFSAALLLTPGSKSSPSIALAIAGYLAAIYFIAKGEESI